MPSTNLATEAFLLILVCPVGFEPTIEISLVRLKVWWFKPLTYGHILLLSSRLESNQAPSVKSRLPTASLLREVIILLIAYWLKSSYRLYLRLLFIFFILLLFIICTGAWARTKIAGFGDQNSTIELHLYKQEKYQESVVVVKSEVTLLVTTCFLHTR